MVPHQMAHPQPTKQNSNVNACATPTMQLITNDPKRARAPSCWENRGTPRHRQNRPENMVPTGQNIFSNFYSPTTNFSISYLIQE